jgi:hypothetical protein
MTTEVIVSLITLTGVIVSKIIDIIDRRASERLAAMRHEETTGKIEVVRNDVNGKMQQLLETSGDAREAKGKLDGVAEEKHKHSGVSGHHQK